MTTETNVQKVRPLLAATRTDEELRKKNTELQLIKERAQWDQEERQKLEALKMALEADKRKVEDALEAERALGMDKDDLLDRSKHREAELEEEIAALQADLDTLDSQLDRALKLQKESDGKTATLRKAFDEAAEHLIRLEAQQKEWGAREDELNGLLNAAKQEMRSLQGDKAKLSKLSEDFKALSAQRDEDVTRSKDRMETLTKDFESRLSHDTREKSVPCIEEKPELTMYLGRFSRKNLIL